MPPNINEYARRLDGFDLSDHEKSELIHTLWRIVESFVERAFAGEKSTSVKDAPQIMDSAGQAAHVEYIVKPNRKPLRDSFTLFACKDGSRRGSP